MIRILMQKLENFQDQMDNVSGEMETVRKFKRK